VIPVLDNPLIRRYRYSSMRPSALCVQSIAYALTIGLVLLINITVQKSHGIYANMRLFWQSLYFQFVFIEFMLLCIWAAHNSGSAISDEISDRSYDFFRLLPLSPRQKTTGILVGRNLPVLLFAAVTFVFVCASGVAGDIPLDFHAQLLAAMLSFTFLANSNCLLTSITAVSKQTKQRPRTNPLPLLFVAALVIPTLVQGLTHSVGIVHVKDVMVYFFSAKIPVLILISLIVLYFASWSCKGILRKFTFENEPLFTFSGAFLFLLGYIVILAGLFFYYAPEGGAAVNLAFWVLSFFPLFIIPFGALKNTDDYLEHIGLISKRGVSDITVRYSLLRYSNLSLGLCLFAAWAVFALAMSHVTGLNLVTHLTLVGVVFSSYCFLWLLIELYVIYGPDYAKIGGLLAFVAIIYLALPLVLGVIIGEEVFYMHSLLSISVVMHALEMDAVSGHLPTVIGMNALLCVIPALLVWRRYAFLLYVRKVMEAGPAA
jgi:hypothetical protein